MATLTDNMTRATNIQAWQPGAYDLVTDDLTASQASADAFTTWLEQYRVDRDTFNATAEEHSIYTLPGHEDGWLTDFMFGEETTYIRDNGGNCYIIPADAERAMPEVLDGDIALDEEE